MFNIRALAKRFRLLTFDGFLVLMESVYLILLPLQKRILLINELLKSLLLECETKGIAVGSDKVKEESTNPTMSLNSPNGTSEYGKNNPAKYTQFINDVSDILFACSDLSHVRCGKLLTLRGEQTTQLNFKDFLKLFEVSWKFVVISEWICQRTCIGLKGTLMTQVL